MRIISFQAENYMRVKLLDVRPKAGVTQFTGKNGQGKTSAVGALFAALRGKKAMPDKPVRKGAEKARIYASLGDGEKIELHVTRTIQPDGSQSLILETAAGQRISQPQAVLDALMGETPGDPLEFIRLQPRAQVEILRKVANVDTEMLDRLTADTKVDYEERGYVNKQVKLIEGELLGMVVQDGLPKEKLDETEIREKMAGATAANTAAREADQKRSELVSAAERAERAFVENKDRIQEVELRVSELRSQLASSEDLLRHLSNVKYKELNTAWEAAEKKVRDAPAGQLVDVSQLAGELEHIQMVNREIDRRTKRDEVQKRLDDERRKAQALTRAMDDREEKKRECLAKAKMPVDGLTFDETAVLYNGMPLGQLGEAEQLRLSALIFMAGNPKLRILPVWHGEALDDDGLAMLEQLCEENNFQILMARVDTSGKVGVVMNDGTGSEAAG